MRATVPPPRTVLGEPSQLGAQRRVIRGAHRLAALRGAMLADHASCPALADAKTVAQHRDRPAPTGWAYQFPRAISFNAQPLRVLSLHPAVLITPPVIRLLADPQLLRRLGDRLPLAEHPLGLAQLADDLLRRVPASLHQSSFLAHCPGREKLSYGSDRSQGVTPAVTAPARPVRELGQRLPVVEPARYLVVLLVWLIVVPEIGVAEPQNCGAPTRGVIARVGVGRVGGLTVDPLMSHFTVPLSPAVQCNPLSCCESDGPA